LEEQLEIVLLALHILTVVNKLVYLEITYQVVVYHELVKQMGSYRHQLPIVRSFLQFHVTVWINQRYHHFKPSAMC